MRYLPALINANGRLGKILISRALMQYGLENPLVISDGTAMSTENFKHCVCHYNLEEGSDWILVHLRECIVNNLENIRRNIMSYMTSISGIPICLNRIVGNPLDV